MVSWSQYLDKTSFAFGIRDLIIIRMNLWKKTLEVRGTHDRKKEHSIPSGQKSESLRSSDGSSDSSNAPSGSAFTLHSISSYVMLTFVTPVLLYLLLLIVFYHRLIDFRNSFRECSTNDHYKIGKNSSKLL